MLTFSAHSDAPVTNKSGGSFGKAENSRLQSTRLSTDILGTNLPIGTQHFHLLIYPITIYHAVNGKTFKQDREEQCVATD